MFPMSEKGRSMKKIKFQKRISFMETKGDYNLLKVAVKIYVGMISGGKEPNEKNRKIAIEEARKMLKECSNY